MKVSSIVKRISFLDKVIITSFDEENKEHILFKGDRNKVPWLLMEAKVAKQEAEEDAPTIGIYRTEESNINTLFIIVENL